MKYLLMIFYLFASLLTMSAYSSDYYVGLGYVDNDFNLEDPFESDSNGVDFHIGKKLNNISAVELSLTQYGNTNNQIVTTQQVNNCHRTYCKPQTVDTTETFKYGVRAVGLWGVLNTDNPTYNVYGKVGAVYAKTSAILGDVSVNDSGFGVGGAVGLNIGQVNGFSAFAEYRLVKVDMDFNGHDIDFEPKAVIAGVRYAF